MRRILLTLLVLTAFGACVAWAQDIPEPAVTPPSWADDTTFQFGIYEDGKRIATAYYRILREKTMDRDAYRFKYTGQDPRISEATEVWVDAATMRPMRSTRKVVYDNKTFYQDAGYTPDGVVLRKRYEGQAVNEANIPAANALYDYEELIWLVPLLEIPDGGQGRFDVFSMLSETVGTVLITATGPEDVELAGKIYHARAYSFNVGMTPYKYWMVMQSGKPVPACIDMGDTRFENLKLDPKKITALPVYKAAVPPASRGKAEDGQDGDNPPPADDSITPYLPPPARP